MDIDTWLKTMKTEKVKEEDKKIIIRDLNIRIGADINDLDIAYNIENELIRKREHLQSCLKLANNEVPTRFSAAIRKAELNTKQIGVLKERSEQWKEKLYSFLNKTRPLRVELNKRFAAINKLEEVLVYLKSFEKIDDLSRQLKQTNDEEQMVLLYGELKVICNTNQNGHIGAYIKEYTHYWHNVLKDKLTKHYEDVLKQLKWPLIYSAENSPPKEILIKFSNLTRYLFLIQEPEDPVNNAVSGDFSLDQGPSLPVKILLRPLKKRFIFHFTGPRQTARIDRPEWFLTQTLTWIKDHQTFVKNNVQPVADKTNMKNVRAVDEFNAGLIALAIERLHTVLALYHTQGSKGEIVDVDAAFAHAVDETLGFHRELVTVTGNDDNNVLSVLTKAETFVRWLAVEKKYALSKMDDTLDSEQWCEAVASGVGAAVGSLVWVPRGADWFITLLKTIEDRYAELPQPGHRLQFLELQLELMEEWRVRLTQLMNAAIGTLQVDSFLSPGSAAHPLTAVVNCAHHTRTVLLQWAHSLHYLQLHYYRRQFEHFTQQQHRDESETSSHCDDGPEGDKESGNKPKAEGENDEALSLNEVELRAQRLALSEVTRRDSLLNEAQQSAPTSQPVAKSAAAETLIDESLAEEAAVFGDAPALLAHLRDAGLTALADHILLEFKAGLREYKRQKWHGLLMVEQIGLSVSSSLCAPLAGLCARLSSVAARLAPSLTMRLRAHLANIVDQYIFEEVVLESWFNTGGTVQFTHDVKRNLIPALAPLNNVGEHINELPKLLEACKLLNMDYDDARRLRVLVGKQPIVGADKLDGYGIKHITLNEALQILTQRTDLSETNSPPPSVMELF